MIITFPTFRLVFGWNSLPLHYEIRTKCCCTTPSVLNVLSTTYVYKVWVQTSEQTYRFRTCFRQHTFIKFEYRQANKLISRTSYSPRLISLLVVGGEKTSLGGEYVGGEIVPWWRVRWWRVCLVASLLGGEVTEYPPTPPCVLIVFPPPLPQ